MPVSERDLKAIQTLIVDAIEKRIEPRFDDVSREINELKGSVEHVASALVRIEERLDLADAQAARNYTHLQKQDERIVRALAPNEAQRLVTPLPHAK